MAVIEHTFVPVSQVPPQEAHRKAVVRLCDRHHQRMEPHGTERLVGDPDQPDGLQPHNTEVKTRAGPAP
jgi:hypothetical protein